MEKTKKETKKKLIITEPTDEVKNEPESEQDQLIGLEHGFDRGVDFITMRDKLLHKFKDLNTKFADLSFDDQFYIRKKRMIFHKIIYCTIAMIQLRCGSRICEAVAAYKNFIETKDFKTKILVKIAKSESIKYTRDTKEQYKTKARYRKMEFPFDWIELDLVHSSDMEAYTKYVTNKKLQKRVLDYLLKYFECNTHSLRYAFINHMLYAQKVEPSKVAKFVGHVNMNQIVRYTQNIEVEKLFELKL